MKTKESSRSTKVIALSLGQTISTLVLLIAGMFATRMLSKTDYATFRQTFLTYNFIAPILMLGLPNALYYFIPRNENRKRAVTVENIILLTGIALLFTIFMLLGGYKYLALRFNNPQLVETMKWMVAYPLYVMPVAVISAVLVIGNRTVLLALYNIITNIVLLLGIITGLFLTHSYSGPLLAQIFIPIIFLPVALLIIFQNLPGKIDSISADSMKEMLKYSAPLGLATMMGTIMLQLDKIIVSWMCTPEEFANYVNGAIEIPLIGVITGSISTVLLSDMSNLCYQKKENEAIVIFQKATQYSASILLPVMVYLAIAAKPFIITLFSSKYIESVLPFLIFLLIIPIRTVMYGSALMALGKSRIIMYRSFFDLLVNLVLSIIFIYFFGYLGAAFATVSTLYLWTVPYNLYHIGKGFKVKPARVLPFKKIGKILLLSAMPAVPAWVFLSRWQQINPVVQLIISACLYFPPTFVILYKQQLMFVPANFEKLIPSRIRNKND